MKNTKYSIDGKDIFLCVTDEAVRFLETKKKKPIGEILKNLNKMRDIVDCLSAAVVSDTDESKTESAMAIIDSIIEKRGFIDGVKCFIIYLYSSYGYKMLLTEDEKYLISVILGSEILNKYLITNNTEVNDNE